MKFFTVQHNASYENPYGEAILSKCYYPVFFKNNGFNLWGAYVEKYGMPFLVGKVPRGSTEDKADELLDKLDNLRQDGSVVVEGDDAVTGEKGIDVSILEGGGSSGTVYSALIEYCDSAISKAILSQTLTTELQGVGSNAASQTHQEIRQDVIDSDKRLVEYWFNKLIEWTLKINYGATVKKPLFVLYQEQDVDMILAERDSKLAATGQVQFTKEYLMSKYGFKDNEITIIDKSVVQPAFAEDETETDAKENELINSIQKESEKEILDFAKHNKKLLQPIFQMIEKGKDYEQIQEYLIALYPKMDTIEIEELIGKGIQIANATGQLSIYNQKRI